MALDVMRIALSYRCQSKAALNDYLEPIAMIEALYWWDQAEKYRAQACSSEDEEQRAMDLELAETCEAIAIDVENRATSG
jgi:hypothetical protein